MRTANETWPLPGQVDPLVSPCAFCRRRLVVGGKQVFTSCSCKAFGPPVTIGALALGVVLVLGGAAWWAARRSERLG
ncbi:MAG: hypothetical protein EOO55_02650 [Hymenobacter sp.]|nr:MAG: hypothetical protein EOO55_02650 [Hymenobacter sp.]